MSNSMKESDIFRPILSWCSLDHLFLAPKTARKSTAINADPTIATDLTTTSVRALSAGEVITSPRWFADNHVQALAL
jgi:hypothetical protein